MMRIFNFRSHCPKLFLRNMSEQTNVRSTTASGSQVYESKRAVDEYLLFHYGKHEDLMPYNTVPGIELALSFPQRSCHVAINAIRKRSIECKRVLDLGCAV